MDRELLQLQSLSDGHAGARTIVLVLAFVLVLANVVMMMRLDRKADSSKNQSHPSHLAALAFASLLGVVSIGAGLFALHLLRNSAYSVLSIMQDVTFVAAVALPVLFFVLRGVVPAVVSEMYNDADRQRISES